MNQEIQIFEEILKEFGKQPKFIPEPTYLELCRYPTSRFEEICTRLLCFYFDPNNEHCFHDLFLESLLQLISPLTTISYRNDQVQVINELNSEGKRLDMLIKSPDMVIGVENKIYASVYNPLPIYSNQIALYGKKNVFKVILTVRNINDIAEKTFISDNGFIVITYSELLNRVKLNIGSYIPRANQKYLVFIYDFIQTIENMTGETYDNNKLSHFFSNNSEKIDNLIALYSKYNERVLKVQIEAIRELMKLVQVRTNDDRWWAWEGWDLGYDAFNKDLGSAPRIGIEASYEVLHNNPLGRFRIYITTWNIKHFAPYEDRLVGLFPDNYLDKTNDNRVYLHLDIIEDNDIDLILDKLIYYYQIMHNIVKEIAID
ncbi:PD-(D/E)XK nuclease family protein [Pedobacter sp. 22163]|uniref:PD-(D/E)XK nuclease family protein n=1 Tax=Pedobacter sp. 22163 TaxID=3453883 RepID=UPI003F838847